MQNHREAHSARRFTRNRASFVTLASRPLGKTRVINLCAHLLGELRTRIRLHQPYLGPRKETMALPSATSPTAPPQSPHISTLDPKIRNDIYEFTITIPLYKALSLVRDNLSLQTPKCLLPRNVTRDPQSVQDLYLSSTPPSLSPTVTSGSGPITPSLSLTATLDSKQTDIFSPSAGDKIAVHGFSPTTHNSAVSSPALCRKRKRKQKRKRATSDQEIHQRKKGTDEHAVSKIRELSTSLGKS